MLHRQDRNNDLEKETRINVSGLVDNNLERVVNLIANEGPPIDLLTSAPVPRVVYNGGK